MLSAIEKSQVSTMTATAREEQEELATQLGFCSACFTGEYPIDIEDCASGVLSSKRPLDATRGASLPAAAAESSSQKRGKHPSL
jgi:hypothetical protein